MATRLLALLLAGLPIFVGVLLLLLSASLVVTGLAWLFGLTPAGIARWSLARLLLASLASSAGLTLVGLIWAWIDDSLGLK